MKKRTQQGIDKIFALIILKFKMMKVELSLSEIAGFTLTEDKVSNFCRRTPMLTHLIGWSKQHRRNYGLPTIASPNEYNDSWYVRHYHQLTGKINGKINKARMNVTQETICCNFYETSCKEKHCTCNFLGTVTEGTLILLLIVNNINKGFANNRC